MREELLGITMLVVAAVIIFVLRPRQGVPVDFIRRSSADFHPRGSDRHLFTVWRRGNDDYRHPLMSLLEELLRSPDFQHCDIECLSLEVTPACQTHVIWSPSTFRASRR